MSGANGVGELPKREAAVPVQARQSEHEEAEQARRGRSQGEDDASRDTHDPT
jgi:hypothetical protein